MPKYVDYQGQIFDAVKSKVSGGFMTSTRFNVLDRLSPVVEANDMPFLATFAPYSVYLMTILEERESVEANMTLDDFYELKAKTASANDIIFRTQIGMVEAPSHPEAEVIQETTMGEPNIAFTTVLSMGEFKGKTPGDVILSAPDKPAAVEALKKHAEFCGRNLSKYPGNQKFIDAVNAAAELYELDLLEDEKKIAQPAQLKAAERPVTAEFDLHTPVDKYYAKKVQKMEGEDFNKCYRYRISVKPGNNYPYHIEITNYWAPISRSQSGLTPIMTAKKRNEVKKTFDLTMAQWTGLIERLSMNTESCHTLFYPTMRQKDESYSYRNMAP